MKNLGLYFNTLLIFLVLDGIWLGVVASGFYAEQLSFLMAEEINWIAAFVFYGIFVLGLIHFVMLSASKKSLKYYFLRGAFFGFVTYATYDLTNLATIQDWPIIVSLIDMVWGSFLGGSTAFLSVYFGRRMLLME